MSRTAAVAPAPMMISLNSKVSVPRRSASTGTLVVAHEQQHQASAAASSALLPLPPLYVPLKSCLSHSNLELYSNFSPEQQQQRIRTNAVRKSVSFHRIEIREHRRALGDNPSVSQGPALALDWESCEAGACSVDDYERLRPPRRGKSELAVPRQVRERILRHEAGVSRGEMAAANRQTEKIRQSRRRHSHDHELAAVGKPLQAIKKLWKSGETKATDREVEELMEQSRQAEQMREQQRQSYLAQLMEQLQVENKQAEGGDSNVLNEEPKLAQGEQHQEAGQATQEEEKKQPGNVEVEEPKSERHLLQKEDRKPSFLPPDVDNKMQDVSEEWEF